MCASPLVHPAFPDAFQAALKLSRTGTAAEAEAAFVRLAEQKAGKRATDESLAQAAYCAAAQKKYDKALSSLVSAKDLFAKNLTDLEDFDQYVDALLWTAAAFIGGDQQRRAAVLDAVGQAVR